MDSQSLKSRLGLVPLSIEGGYYLETYRSDHVLPPECLDGRYRGRRSLSTAIYYLLDDDTFSELHRLNSDEIFHFYLGDPVAMLQLWPDGSHREIVIGTDLDSGMHPQVVVPRGVWQGLRLQQGGRVALLGCTVSPGFDYEDYESGSRNHLVQQYPQARDLIFSLTRS